MSARIALVTLEYPPDVGGVGQYLFGLVNASGGAMQEIKTTINQEIKRSWWPIVGLMRLLRSQGYEHVLVSHVLPVGTAAWIARMRGGLSYSVIIHGLDLRCARKYFWKKWLARRVLLGATKVIANSEAVAKEICAFDGRLRPMVILPAVMPRAFLSREDARRLLSVSEEEKIILIVTRLVPRKGIDRLIEAMRDNPSQPPLAARGGVSDHTFESRGRGSVPPLLERGGKGELTRLVIIGDGEDHARLEKIAAPVRDRVTFLGNVTDEERDRWYAAADVFAMPVRDEGDDVEGFGIVFLEAAMAGLPVIAGCSGGAPEAVLENETGLLVDPNDVAAIHVAIERLFNDDALRKRLGENGRARVLRDFQWEDRWKKLASLLLPYFYCHPRENGDLVPDSRFHGNDKEKKGNDKEGDEKDRLLNKISIIIPCHNHAEELTACLSSLEKQSVKPGEVIVVDDGSIPPVALPVRAFPFPVTLVRLEKNLGAPAARNEGFRRSRGECVMFLDADGVLEMRALEKLCDALEQKPDAAFAYSAFDYGWKRFASQPFDVKALQQCNYIHTSALIRRKWFFGFDETLKKFQDWDLWLTIAERDGRGVFVKECLMRFATRRGGMSKWLPSFVHRIPWPVFGWMPDEVRKYREAEAIIKRKHGI